MLNQNPKYEMALVLNVRYDHGGEGLLAQMRIRHVNISSYRRATKK